jgi:hypothetical protein
LHEVVAAASSVRARCAARGAWCEIYGGEYLDPPGVSARQVPIVMNVYANYITIIYSS